MTASEIEFGLRHFTGTEQWFRHHLNRQVLYTEGVRYLAEHAGAYWLIDDIAIHNLLVPELQAEDFQLWQLQRDGASAAVLTAEDGNGHVLFTQNIEFTDFPLDKIRLYSIYDSSQRVIMLLSEY